MKTIGLEEDLRVVGEWRRVVGEWRRVVGGWRRVVGWCLLFTGTVLIAWGFFSGWQIRNPLISPMGDMSIIGKWSNEGSESKKVVLGFMPFWNLKYESLLRYDRLAYIAFFGLDVRPDGSINTHTADGFEEPGWTAYNSNTFGAMVRKAHDNGGKIVLVLRAFDNVTIESIVKSQKNRQTLIENALKIVSQKNLDGVNVDFEYTGNPPDSVRKNFTDLVEKLATACRKQLAGCHISIDTYADAASQNRLWDLEELGKYVDHIIVMAYDFTRASSAYSGSVAPLHLIKESLMQYSKQITMEKLLLGVAYYGYEWPTYSEEPESKTRAMGGIATYRRIQDLIVESAIQTGWDDESLTPYLIIKESGRVSQIFFDDVRSLSYKYDFVNEAGLSGVAIWALGYDGKQPELWNLLDDKFNQ